jgi:hypothetical protein
MFVGIAWITASGRNGAHGLSRRADRAALIGASERQHM